MEDDGVRQALERQLARLQEEAAARQEEATAKQAAADAVRHALAEIAKADAISAKRAPIVRAGTAQSPDDLTISDLVRFYRSDERSPYHEVLYATRKNYDDILKRIDKDCGDRKIANLRAEDTQQLYEQWKQRGPSTAHGIVTMLRQLANFGATILKNEKCLIFQVILHNMRIKAVERARVEYLSREQAEAIIVQAHKMGKKMAPIALAQAFQVDCDLRQKDVIGEWVPAAESDPGLSLIDHRSNLKWLRGLRWNHIDDNLILRHVASRGRLRRARIYARHPWSCGSWSVWVNYLKQTGPSSLIRARTYPIATTCSGDAGGNWPTPAASLSTLRTWIVDRAPRARRRTMKKPRVTCE